MTSSDDSRDRYPRARELHLLARDMPEEERVKFLEEQCGSNEQLRQEVEALLDSAEAGFLSSDPTETVGVEPQIPGAGEAVRYFGDYEILEEIARGGMGIVYRARQKSLNRIVALKMILSGQLASNDAIERFYREAEAAASLRHPNIVTIHEVGEHEGHHYFSMDHVDGESLATKLEQGPLDPDEAAEFARTIALAIQTAHDTGVLHRDLKPANLLIDSSGRLHITDFGLSKSVPATSDVATGLPSDSAPDLTIDGTIVGTPAYMAPEQANAEEISPQADIYAVGATLYHMLVGRPPFVAKTLEKLLHDVRNKEPVSPDTASRAVPREQHVPKNLALICMKCLAKNPEERYASATALAADLDLFLKRKTPVGAKPGLPLAVWNYAQKNLMQVAVVTGLAIYALAGVIYWQLSHLDWVNAGKPAAPDDTSEDPHAQRQIVTFFIAFALMNMSAFLWYLPLWKGKFRGLFRLRELHREREHKLPATRWYLLLGAVTCLSSLVLVGTTIDRWVWSTPERDSFETFSAFFFPCFVLLFGSELLLVVLDRHVSRTYGETDAFRVLPKPEIDPQKAAPRRFNWRWVLPVNVAVFALAVWLLPVSDLRWALLVSALCWMAGFALQSGILSERTRILWFAGSTGLFLAALSLFYAANQQEDPDLEHFWLVIAVLCAGQLVPATLPRTINTDPDVDPAEPAASPAPPGGDSGQ